MDSFELNKIAAAVLIALLLVKAADLISNALIHPQKLKETAFKIEGAAGGGPIAEAGETKKGPAPLEPLLAMASAEQGAIIFKKCVSCHTVDKEGSNRVGPNLYGIVGAEKAKHSGYAYSPAMKQKGGVWSFEDLNIYLYSPRDFVPGTKMAFVGVKDDKERADLIAYLRQQSDSPVPLPIVKEPVETEAKAGENSPEKKR
jgi:cytochrome c